MPRDQVQTERSARELAQLIRIQERLLTLLLQVRNELSAPTTIQILRRIRKRTGNSADEIFGDITTSVEEAIRALNVFESEVQRELLDDPEETTVEGIPDLPPHLARFLAERAQLPGFSFEVKQDPVRGWTICWKEYTPGGTVRGYGQIYERPHAWLED